MMFEWIRFILTACCVLAGVFILVASVRGVYKFQYALNRMHAAAMGDTLGILFVLAGLIISAQDIWLIVKLALIIVFLWMSSPVSSHLITRLEVNTNALWKEDLAALRKAAGEGEIDGIL